MDNQKRITIHVTYKYTTSIAGPLEDWPDDELAEEVAEVWREFIPENITMEPEDTLIIHAIVEDADGQK